ncbi:hypothetical protein D3C71_2096230 [compost metagenome]
MVLNQRPTFMELLAGLNLIENSFTFDSITDVSGAVQNAYTSPSTHIRTALPR